MNKHNFTISALTMLVGSLISLSSQHVRADNDDELLVFVKEERGSVDLPKVKSIEKSLLQKKSSADAVNALTAHTSFDENGTESVRESHETLAKASGNIANNIKQGTAPAGDNINAQNTNLKSTTDSIEMAIFTPVQGRKTSEKTLTEIKEPQLTAAPVLPVAIAPLSIIKSSPKQNELRGIFYHAVLAALQRSPQIRSAQYQRDAASEEIENAKGQRWPQVDVTSNSRRYEFGHGSRSASDSNLPSLGLNISTNLIDFGQTSNTIKSKEFSEKAAAYYITAQTEDLAWQVSSALVELSKQRLIINMSQQYVARMKELVDMLKGIVDVDVGRRSELTQATGRYLQAQSALDNAVSKARDTEIILYRLLGETQVPLPPATQWQLTPSSLEHLIAAVDRHPILAQAREQSKAAFAEADALKASNLPKVNWVVSKDTGKDIYGREQSWQTGINVSWGLFRGGSAGAAERAAVQRASAISEEADFQRDDLLQRVRAADQDARSMLQRADLFRNLTAESDRIRLDFFDQWYHLGKRTLLDVLSAESDYYNNRVAEVTNRFDGYSSIFRGYASAGMLSKWLRGEK